jgi:hypothetical protein
MPTGLKDELALRKGEFWGGFGIGCVLKSYLTGTVCFPLGAEFGCGSKKTVGVEKEQSIELKLGAEHEGIGLDITIGTKTTKKEEWEVEAKECDWCKPELCYPNSRVEVWTCSNVLTLYRYDYDKTYFYPGPTAEMRQNCRSDPQRCHCEDTPHHTAEPPPVHETGAQPHAATVIRSTTFARSEDSQPVDAPAAADSFAALFEDALAHPSLIGGQGAVGFTDGRGPINWCYPCDEKAQPELTLMSRQCGDPGPSDGAALLPGRFLPVLAVAPRLPQATASVTATLTTPTSPPQVVEAQPEVRTGSFTTVVFAELDLGTPAPASGTTVVLDLSLMPSSGCPGRLLQPYVVVS